MIHTRYPWDLGQLISCRPTVGLLMALCEENYRQFLHLAPEVRTLSGSYRSRIAGMADLDLHLEILEQTPYTTLVHLTYYFPRPDGRQPDPDATLRVYFDAQQIEVLELKQRALPLNTGPRLPTLRQKWRVNLFLSKWLRFSVGQGHIFNPEAKPTDPRGEASDIPACF